MIRFVHCVAWFLCGLLPWAAAGCVSADLQLISRIDASLARAGRYLVQRQDADGAWRSRAYGALRDGPSLTPLVMSVLFFLPQATPGATASYTRGVDYLVGFVGPDGQIRAAERELLFPVYTSASASRVVRLLESSPRNLQAQQAWLAYLRGRQLTEAMGWSPGDPQYGGWGFAMGVPRKPADGQPREMFVESNLTSTVFALAALRSAKTPTDDPAYSRALVFVQRCQNFPALPVDADARYDDGGFFFMPDDPVQNKAGVAGADRRGRTRFHSYGTMTADGLRALIRCGLPPSHPRVAAARRWLEQNFDPAHNPGVFEADREVLRDATYYYWAWAVSHAFAALGVRQVPTPRGPTDWATALAEELLSRQRDDGSWANRYSDAKEDDPLVATPWAAAALAICRSSLMGQAHGQAPVLVHRLSAVPPSVKRDATHFRFAARHCGRVSVVCSYGRGGETSRRVLRPARGAEISAAAHRAILLHKTVVGPSGPAPEGRASVRDLSACFAHALSSTQDHPRAFSAERSCATGYMGSALDRAHG